MGSAVWAFSESIQKDVFFYILKVNFWKYKFDTYQWLAAFDQLNNFDRLLVFIGNIERRLR